MLISENASLLNGLQKKIVMVILLLTGSLSRHWLCCQDEYDVPAPIKFDTETPELPETKVPRRVHFPRICSPLCVTCYLTSVL